MPRRRPPPSRLHTALLRLPALIPTRLPLSPARLLKLLLLLAQLLLLVHLLLLPAQLLLLPAQLPFSPARLHPIPPQLYLIPPQLYPIPVLPLLPSRQLVKLDERKASRCYEYFMDMDTRCRKHTIVFSGRCFITEDSASATFFVFFQMGSFQW